MKNKDNFRDAKCCLTCYYSVIDGGNCYCDEDNTCKDVFISSVDSEILWKWATTHGVLKTKVCDHYTMKE